MSGERIDVGISVAEAARRIGCDPSRVRKLLKSGKLCGYRDGRRIRVRESSVNAYQASAPIGGGESVSAALRESPLSRQRHNEALALLKRMGVRLAT